MEAKRKTFYFTPLLLQSEVDYMAATRLHQTQNLMLLQILTTSTARYVALKHMPLVATSPPLPLISIFLFIPRNFVRKITVYQYYS
jgi:hypothetical protein